MPRSKTFVMPHGRMLRQLHESRRTIADHEQRLRDTGWVWSNETQQWTHPQAPGVTISY